MVRSLIPVAFLLIVAGCAYDKEDELYPAADPLINCDTVGLTYNSDLKPFFDTKCAVSGCHVSGQQAPDLSSYWPANAAAGDLYHSATNSSHAGRFSWDACDKARLRIWSANPVEQ